jgi:hypothetical protein
MFRELCSSSIYNRQPLQHAYWSLRIGKCRSFQRTASPWFANVDVTERDYRRICWKLFTNLNRMRLPVGTAPRASSRKDGPATVPDSWPTTEIEFD